MGNTQWGQLQELKTGHEQQIAGLQADVRWLRSEMERLQDEIVPLREQMETPQEDDVHTEEVLRDGALMTVLWQRHPRWSMPEVVGVYHGAYCLYAAHGAGDLGQPPAWAVEAVRTAVVAEHAEAA